MKIREEGMILENLSPSREYEERGEIEKLKEICDDLLRP